MCKVVMCCRSLQALLSGNVVWSIQATSYSDVYLKRQTKTFLIDASIQRQFTTLLSNVTYCES